jgi:uncharacterized Tic20 family protein
MEQKEYWGMQVNAYCMLIHLSQLASIVMPGLGFVLPVIMWVANKDKNVDIDKHGRVTINWLISFIIYSFVCGILMIVLIGYLGLLLLLLLNVVFAIVAAVKANNGEFWVYPLSIKFLKY